MDNFRRDFELSRKRHQREFRVMNMAFWTIFIVAILAMPAIGYVAYKANCLRSMVLNVVCLSEPALDEALKKILGR